MTAREAALQALTKRRRTGARLDTALSGAVQSLSPRDAALAMRLCYGTVQNGGILDFALHSYIKKIQPQVLDILRMGAYQLWYLDRIPRHAVTDEAVRLCKKTAPHAAGLVNAVLRRLPEEPPEIDDPVIKYSLPQWFCDKMAAILPAGELDRFFASCNAIPPIIIQGNTLRDPTDIRSGPCLPEELDEILRNGRGIVADPAAKRAVEALGPEPGQRVWDVCAAPGGKTAMISMAMRNEGYLLATDKSADKLPMIEQTLFRIGATVADIRQADGAAYMPDGLFDAILCDVPCSGFGVLRKKPDIRFRTEVSHFPALQLSILRNAAKALKKGGILVYSTCTLFPEENEGVIQGFLTGGFTAEHMETLWPHRGDTDGFFICRMKKK